MSFSASDVGGAPLRLQGSTGAASTSEPRNFTARWTADEIVALRRGWADPSVTRVQIADNLGRTLRAVESMSRLLFLGPKARERVIPAWTAEEKAYLCQHWHTQTRYQIAEHLGRSPGAVSNHANKLNLGQSRAGAANHQQSSKGRARERGARIRAERLAAGVVRRTPERRVILERGWPEGRLVAEIAAAMNRLPGPTVDHRHVSGWASDLLLRRPPGFVAAPPSLEESRGAATLAPPVLRLAPTQTAKHQPINRACLRCERSFRAPTRFVRLCDVCRKVSEGIA